MKAQEVGPNEAKEIRRVEWIEYSIELAKEKESRYRLKYMD